MIAAIQHAAARLSVRRLCQLVGVSRSWDDAHPIEGTRAAREVALRDAVEWVVLAFAGYGYRRVTHALAREG